MSCNCLVIVLCTGARAGYSPGPQESIPRTAPVWYTWLLICPPLLRCRIFAPRWRQGGLQPRATANRWAKTRCDIHRLRDVSSSLLLSLTIYVTGAWPLRTVTSLSFPPSRTVTSSRVVPGPVQGCRRTSCFFLVGAWPEAC